MPVDPSRPPLLGNQLKGNMFLEIEQLTANTPGQPGFNSYWKEVKGKRRLIHDPNDHTRVVQSRLLVVLRRQGLPNLYATAKPGSSIVDNILPHRENRYVVGYDLYRAYENVDGLRLAACFGNGADQLSLLGDEAVMRFLQDYCLLGSGKGLRFGGPASQDLFNLYCRQYLDFDIGVLCRRWGVTYTRYVDDLTFSSQQPIGKHKRRALRGAIRAAGFSISRSKAQVIDLEKHQRIVIAGVGLEYGGRLFVPGKQRREIEKLLRARSRGSNVDQALLEGHIAHFMSIMANSGPFGDPSHRLSERDLRIYYAHLQMGGRYNCGARS